MYVLCSLMTALCLTVFWVGGELQVSGILVVQSSLSLADREVSSF